MFLALGYQLESELLSRRAQYFLTEAASPIGLLVILLFTLTSYFFQIVRRRAQKLEATHQSWEHEITERKCVEEKLTLYREIIANSSEAIAILNPQGYYLEQNSAHHSLLGYSNDDLRGKTPAIHLGDEVISAIAQELKGASSYRSEVISRTKQGVLLNLELSAFVLRNNAGEPVCTVGLKRDITKRKQAEEALRESEERFRTMANTAPVMLWVSDSKGLCTFFNQPWLSFTGRTLEQEIDNGWTEGLHFEDLQYCLDTYMSANDARQSFKIEYRLKRFDSNYRWILSTGVPRFMPDGSFVGYIGSSIDITERKQTEEVLRRQEQTAQAQVEELEKLNQLKDEFLSTVSHELRTPLTNIKMGISMLEIYLNRENKLSSKDTKPNADDSKVSHYLQVLKDECEREISITNNLLDLQQLEAGFRPLALETIQLQNWLCKQVRPFQDRADSRGQILQVGIISKLPSIISESASMERILAELLNNACKYTPPGEYITVTACAESEIILLTVSNTGIKISANHLPHIFERFYRIPQTDRWKQGGTGLGLALTQKLVERLGGSIQVESAEAHTCFTVKLPQVIHTQT